VPIDAIGTRRRTGRAEAWTDAARPDERRPRDCECEPTPQTADVPLSWPAAGIIAGAAGRIQEFYGIL